MTVDSQSKEGQAIRRLIPFSTTSTEQFESICAEISIETAEPNTFLFKKNDSENKLFYLIQGSIRLQSDKLIVESINSESESSKFALAHQIPRKIDALTLTRVLFIKIDSTLLSDSNISDKQEENNYMAIDEPEDDNNNDDWMTTLLKSPIFRALPPANLQQIIMSLMSISVKKGDFIIKQGDTGDYYYLIKKGHCLISRKPTANAKEIKLAQLSSQDTFGEDSLLSGKPRNVSVTALTDTSLIRLSKDKFISLIKEPSLKFITHSQLANSLTEETVLIDVRSPDEYSKHHLAHSINTPFFSLRMHIKSLDKKKPVIIVCKDGKTSEAAAFLLLRNKISAQIIEGGIKCIPEEYLEFNIDNINDTATINSTITTEEKPSNAALSLEPLAQTTPDNALLTENKQLKSTIQILKSEKEALEKKYRMLFKQTEKLKSVLDSLKK